MLSITCLFSLPQATPNAASILLMLLLKITTAITTGNKKYAYTVSNHEMKQDKAELYCISLGASLAHFDTLEAFSELANEVEGTEGIYFIGMKDTNDSYEGLIWSHNGEPAYFPGMQGIWETEPNDSNKLCVMMKDSLLQERKCHFSTKYICMKELSIDGNWGEWGLWSPCIMRCSGGRRSRTRNCDSPAPNHIGTPCPASTIEYQPCF